MTKKAEEVRIYQDDPHDPKSGLKARGKVQGEDGRWFSDAPLSVDEHLQPGVIVDNEHLIIATVVGMTDGVNPKK